MHVLTWAANHRILALGMGAAVTVGLVGIGLWFFLFRSPATQVDLSQALRLYRQAQRPGTATADPRLPPPGVYRYRTSGGEQLSLGGIARTFPAVTQMIVTGTRCATMDWEPFEQHVEGLVECPATGQGVRVDSLPTYEEIAGIRSTTDIRCPPDAYLVPPRPAVGATWRATCAAPGTAVAYAGQLLGTSSVDVAGRVVPALHVRITLTISGAESGSNPTDYWLAERSGVILRQQETVALGQRNGPLGSVRYSEEMTISLDALSPTR